DMEPEQYFDEAPNEEAIRFYDQLEKSSHPLCEGSLHSALSVAVRFMNIKFDWNVPNAAMNSMVDLLGELANPEFNITKNFYQAKCLVSKLGLTYDRIHYCVNGCMLFYKTDSELENYRLEENIPVITTKLEKIFPCGFFDVMEHLPIHLVQEAYLEGPVQTKWMYPFERRNRPNRNNEGDIDHLFPPISIFNQIGQGSKNRGKRSFTSMEMQSVVTHILLNCPKIQPYLKQSYDPFIIAHNAKPVYYAPYPLRRDKVDWWVVIKTKLVGRIEIDNVLDVAYQNKVAIFQQVDVELKTTLEYPQHILEEVSDDDIIINVDEEINEDEENDSFDNEKYDNENETTKEEKWENDGNETSEEE
ncbi:hypothetical protein MTR67_051305, partial [Solanum verrucosum]